MRAQQPIRLVIYPKDVERLTGLSPQAARRLLNRVRLYFRKPKGSFVTVYEFCQVTGIAPELVLPQLH